MKVSILTLFPKMFEGPLTQSIMWRAVDKGFTEIDIVDMRKWAIDTRGSVDDRPYGGGAGMILRVDVIDNAITDLKKDSPEGKTKVVLMDAGGERYTQKKAQEYSELDRLIIICGHYEGVDHRVHEHLVDDVISIGDYILTGGEIPAMVLTDSIVRLIPGVIKPESLAEESFSPDSKFKIQDSSIEYPQYTRPEDYKGWKVPKVLLSGNHKEIEKWRKRTSE